LLGAVALVVLAGCSPRSMRVSTVSIARVEELVRDGRGAGRLARMMVATRTALHQPGGAAADRLQGTATVLLAAYLTGRMGVDLGLFGRGDHGGHQFRGHRGGPAHAGPAERLLHRAGRSAPLHAISVLLTPISRLLILLGNALTPGRGFRNGPFASRSSCARWSTWPSSAAWWPTTNAG
jgi:hypothetical protein